MSIPQKEKEIIENLQLFPDWNQRYEYIITEGRKLPEFPSKYQINENLLKGCQSQVWIAAEEKDEKIYYFGNSDSTITKGILSFFIKILNESSLEEILKAKFIFIEETELKNHLAPTRANALSLIPEKMKQLATAPIKK